MTRAAEDERELNGDYPEGGIVSAIGSHGSQYPIAPRALLEAHQGNPDQTQIWGNGGRPMLVAPGRVETLARIRADDPLAQTAIIALGSPHSGTVIGPVAPLVFPYAVIEWGTGGVTHQAIADFIEGQQLSVSGSWVQVSGGSEAASVAPVLLGASLAYGYARGNARPPTRTLRHSILVAPTTVTFAVPAFAIDLRYYRQPAANGPFFLEFLDSAGTMIYQQQIAANTSQENPIPIAADCTQVRVRVVGVGLSAGRLMFGLAL